MNTTPYPNRLSSPNRQLQTEPVLSEAEGNNELLTSIENQTLAHFRHFSSLFTKFPSTFVVSALQIAHFMQNKPNFQKAQMNVNKVITKDYEDKTLGERGKNKPNSKPKQTQSNPIKANKMPKQTQYKPNQTQFQTQKMLPRLTINVFWLYLVNIICVNLRSMEEMTIKKPPKGLMVLVLVGPAFVWAAEYIGSGEVILATRTGAILGTTVLWAIVLGIFLKFWIGMSGARYTVCTGEGMIDMFDRMPGGRHWAVWTVLVIQFVAATFSIGAVVTAAGIFVNSLLPVSFIAAASTVISNIVNLVLLEKLNVTAEQVGNAFPALCGWVVTIAAVTVVWSGGFNVLKIVMSILVLIVVVGVMYVAAHVFPGIGELFGSLSFSVPEIPEWAASMEEVSNNPWREILPLLGWGAGGFASQVWYTYWVLGAGYGAAAGRGYGRPADVSMLKEMPRAVAEKIKGWCRVLYVDSSIAMVIGIVVTSAFLIAGVGVLRPAQIAPQGEEVAIELSRLFSEGWGPVGGFLFMLGGAAALISTQIGQLAGWPRLLADSCRICIPGFNKKFAWKKQFRFFLLFFLCANMVIIFCFTKKPVKLIQGAALIDGLLLTPLQAILVAVGLFVVMPKLLSAEAARVLRPSRIFAVGLIIAFLVFGYFCVVQMPSAILEMVKGAG